MAEKYHEATEDEDGHGGVMAAAPSLCYCVHKEIEQSEEIMTVAVEVKGQRPKAAVVATTAAAAFFESPRGGGGAASISNEDTDPAKGNRGKGDRIMERSIFLPDSERRITAASSAAINSPPSPPPPSPSPPPPQAAAPSLVVQVMPPTPTSEPRTPPATPSLSSSSESSEWPTGRRGPKDLATKASKSPNITFTPSNAEVTEQQDCSSKRRSIIPKLTLPLIQLSTEEDQDQDDANQPLEPKVDEEAEPDQEGGKRPGGSRGRKRRKSLANLLFAGGGGKGRAGEESQQLSTPTIEAPQGQRLHFRRVSEVFSLGGLGVGGGGGQRRDSKSACVSPAVTPADCTGGLSIRNLFPYRHGVFELESDRGTLVPSPKFSTADLGKV